MASMSAIYANNYAVQEPTKNGLHEVFWKHVIDPPSTFLLQMFCCHDREVFALEPQVTECNHMFCKPCIELMLEGAGRCDGCNSCITRESTKDLKAVNAELYKLYDSMNVRCPRGDTHKCSWTGKLSALADHIHAFEAIGTLKCNCAADIVKLRVELKSTVDDLTQRVDRVDRVLQQSERSDDHAKRMRITNKATAFDVDDFDVNCQDDVNELVKYLGSHWDHSAPDSVFRDKLYKHIMGVGSMGNAIDVDAQTTRAVLTLGAGMLWFSNTQSIAIETMLKTFQQQCESKTNPK